MPARERRPPIEPPVAPMLGKLARDRPEGQTAEAVPLGLIDVVAADAFVLDGEILVAVDGRYDFATLMTRLHPRCLRAGCVAWTALGLTGSWPSRLT